MFRKEKGNKYNEERGMHTVHLFLLTRDDRGKGYCDKQEEEGKGVKHQKQTKNGGTEKKYVWK